MADLVLTKVGQNANGDPIIGWTPVPGAAGYRFQSRANAPKWSVTWDGTRDRVTFPKGQEPYRVEALSVAASGSYPSPVPAGPTTRLAWFYNRPTDGTSAETIVARHKVVMLTGSDWGNGFVSQVRQAGWTKPILQYVDTAFAMGPVAAVNGVCTPGYQGWSNNVCWSKDDYCNYVNSHEDWHLHNGAGKRIYRDAGGGGAHYLMNPGAQGWRDFVVSRLQAAPSLFHMDGFFLDDVWGTKWRPSHQETNSDGTTREYATDAAWHTAYMGFLQAVKAGITTPVWINTDDTSAAGYVSVVDGLMIENMGASWGTSYAPQAEVEQRWRDTDAHVAAGRDVLLVGQGPSRTDIARMRYAHAVYLMVAGPKVSFRFQNAGDYRAFWDYPEYLLDLGVPLEGRAYVGGSVWRRRFVGRTVTVDLASHTGTIS